MYTDRQDFSGMGDTGDSWVRRILMAAVIVLLVVIAYFAGGFVMMRYDRFTIEKTTRVTSSADGSAYRVHEQHEHPQKAADTLAELNKRVVDLMRYLRRRYVQNPGREAHSPARIKAVDRLLARYNPDNLAENSPKDPSGDTAYSVDKGAIVAICLRARDGPNVGKIHDIGILTFVTLHEMSHIAVEAIDHPPEFWSTFKFLLASARDSGVYASPDLEKNPTRYCGTAVDYSPLWDPATPSI